MKKLLVFLCIICFATNCSAPKKIKTTDNLFIELAYRYDLADYNIILRTKDSVFHFSNASVLVNGKIKADNIRKPDSKKKITFYTKEDSKNILEYMKDSLGNETNDIEFSKAGIKKIIVYNDFQGKNKRMVYDKNANVKVFFTSLLFLMMIAGVVAYVFFLIFLVEAVFSWCYIATMVYGSYDAPEVLVLRKFRDEKLAPYFMGRVFIRIYYTLSPGFVFLFKNNKPVNQFCKSILDRWVKRLGSSNF